MGMTGSGRFGGEARPPLTVHEAPGMADRARARTRRDLI